MAAVEPKRRLRVPGMVALEAVLMSSCGNGVPVRTEPAQPLALVVPADDVGNQYAQYAAAVQQFAGRAALERTIPSDTVSYVGIQSALQALSDALVLLPRGSDVLIARIPAGEIRADVVRIGAGPLDNTGRTEALRHALLVAAETLDTVARGAYPNVAALPALLSALGREIAAIDDSELLWTQRARVSSSFDSTLAILETMRRASI